MVLLVIKTLFYRLLLPLSLLFGASLRPSLISLIYVAFALLGSLLPSINASSAVPFSTKVYFVFVLTFSAVISIFQFAYQIYESLSEPDIAEYTRKCNSSSFEYWMRQAGFIRIKRDEGFDTVRVVFPEVLSLAVSVGTFIVCIALSHQGTPDRRHSGHVQAVRSLSAASGSTMKISHFADALIAALKRLSDVAIILLVAVVGIIQPSLLNFVYFFAFLFVATWWAAYTPLRRRIYNAVKLLLVLYAALHLLIIFAYQIPFVQETLPGASFIARLVGLAVLLQTDCTAWWSVRFIPNHYWTAFSSALLVLVLYHLLIAQYEWTRYGIQRSLGAIPSEGSSVHEELLGEEEEASHRESVPMQRVTSVVIDRRKIASIFAGSDGIETVTSQGLIAVMSFCLYHGYVFGLLAMMLWALVYHSVFGLVFLVLACFFWVFKDTRSVAFRASPAILAYAEFLLVAQYVCSMDISDKLPKDDILELVGFIVAKSRSEAFTTLLVKSLLCLPLFALLRLYLREKFYNSLSDRDRLKRLTYGTFSSSTQNPSNSVAQDYRSEVDESRGAQAVSLLSRALTKYWIFLVTLVLLLVSLQSPPVLYAVGYFIWFGLLISLLQVSLSFFRKSLYAYWTIVIIYSSLVLVAVYCYQFPGVPEKWRQLTGLNKEWNHDIGLINYKEEGDTGALFTRLIAPISFFIFAMLQLKFFHDSWSRLVTAPSGAAVNSEAFAFTEGNTSYYAKVKVLFKQFTELLWRMAEVHVSKVVMLVLIIVAVNNVCALNLLIVTFISVAVCLPAISPVLSIFLCIYMTVFAVARMVYQMHFISENITEEVYSDTDICNLTGSGENLASTMQWLGFNKVSDIGGHLEGLIVAMVALAAQAVVFYRQRHKRLLRGESTPPRGIIFPEADPVSWDRSLVDMFKFFANYGFYKFGLEITMTMMVVVAWVRMDLLGTLLLLWLFTFCCVSRVTCRRLWPLFLIYVAVLFPLQYAIYVGLPPMLCIDYPWSHWLPNPLQNDNLVLWLDLASYRIQLHASYSVADFFLLMMVACQEYAFHAENSTNPPPAAGNNRSIYTNGVYKLVKDNPYRDFVAEQRNFVDFLKIAVFMYGHWATLVMVLIAGLGGVSLFALGYIVLAFWMLWQGNNLYSMGNYQRTVKRWKTVVLYTVFVMIWKVALQVVGCAFIHLLKEANLCYLRQLFSIVCVSTAENRLSNYYFEGQETFDAICTVQQSETQIGFDTFAFGFLVLQMRILHSYYFQHCMLDFRAEAVLSNRGAVLTNQLIEKEMKEQNEQQSRKFKEIKERTAVIRKRYEEQQLHGGAGAFTPETYGQAKRAGDYYMFEYDPTSDELVVPVESFVPEVTPGASDFDKLDPAQLLHTAVQRDLDLAGTLNAVETAEKIKDEEKRMIEAVSGDNEEKQRRGVRTKDMEQVMAEEQTDSAQEEPKSGVGAKLIVGLRFVGKILLSALDWSAAFLNRRCRDHRYVAYVLGKEKEKLKMRLRGPLIDASQPLHGVREEFERNHLHCVSSESDIEQLEQEALDNWQQRNVFARLITAAGHCLAAHTDIICYLFAVIDHARSSGLLSLPLPLLVFFWGSLASPRPSKMFWVVMIGYTQLCVVVKFICQFGFFPWNETTTSIKLYDSFNSPVNIIGVRKEQFYAAWDIVLLVGLFFHRYMLRKMGIWKDANVSDTFIGDSSLSDPAEVRSDSENQQMNLEAEADAQLTAYKNDGTPAAEAISSKQQPAKRGPVASFFYQLFHPKFRYIRDLYPFMFLLDVLCFFVVSFGFSSFGYGGSGSVVKDISSNRVPITFVVMLIVISVMIVVDRALYLRKAVLCKLVYQYTIIVFIHIWIFFILPFITYRAAWKNVTAQFLYFVKCVYLLVSAWQIRNSYPQLCIGNLITHAYGLANMIFFKIFMAIPFIFELRTAIDWTWTDTSMPLFDYFNMENFYATIYNLKCARTFEQNFPAPRGVPKGTVVKYLMGIPMILLLILIIWLPLLAFSLLNRIGIVLLPNNAQMTIGIEGYPPLFTIEAQGIELEMLNDTEYDAIVNMFSKPSSKQDAVLLGRQAVAFINEYTKEDILKVRFRPESETVWGISSDALTAMKYELKEGIEAINAIVRLKFERPRSGESKEPTVHSSTITIPLEKNSHAREDLIDLLNGTDPKRNMTLVGAFPPYVIVPNEGEIKSPPTLVAVMQHNSTTVGSIDRTLSDIVMKLKSADGKTDMLWTGELEQNNVTASLTLPLEYVKYGADRNLKYIQMVAFVDRVFPTFITKYVQGGIIAMYVAVVLLVGRLIRGIITNAPLDVIISEIPNPDYLLKICLDIYLVREAKDFVLEQDLFAKLIFLFRSPATLIKWTRFKVKRD